ncbi:MAG: excinuclease ABC subunit UvrA, partial [Thermodesulfovibrionales bacterium]
MSERELLIEGAKQNNLKNITLKLPHNKVIAVTGVSGSGKSSLAFDTIFAEGQWRFIESISSYARLFLEKLDRPDVDAIHNIRPAVALEQKNPVRGSRSTVGTLTETYDFLRLLYAKVSTPYCPRCGKEIRKWDTSQVVSELIDRHSGEKALVIFETKESAAELRKRGFQRAWLHDEIVDLNSEPSPPDSKLLIILDRLVIREDPRLPDSVEMAWREGNESIMVIIFRNPPDSHKILRFSSSHACDECGIVLPEPSPLLFSFNHPVGACTECKGFGNILRYDEERVVPDRHLSLAEGAIAPWEKSAYRWWKRQFIAGAKKAGLDVRAPYDELAEEVRQKIFKGNSHFYGINDFFEELEGKRYKLHVRVFLSRYRTPSLCPVCAGKRLRSEALAYKVSGYDIAELCDMPLSRLASFFKDIDLSPFQRDIAKEILRQIAMKLSFFQQVGLDYLTLSRQGKTLSGGEYQRINLANQLGSYLTGTLYVLDEPTVGLHPRDTERIAKILSKLSEIGNTIIVVEHDKGIIKAADWVVELGPGGGRQGGEVLFSGPMEGFMKADTLTSRYVRGIQRIQPTVARQQLQGHKTAAIARQQIKKPFLTLSGAMGNNLKDITLNVPLRSLTAITGVSGSGKSSLIVDTLYKALAKHFALEQASPLPYTSLRGMEFIKGLRIIDQSPIGRSPRSNPATYLKVFDQIRRLFSEQPESRAHGYGPGFFSFNVPGGRCEACKGEGYQKLEMYFFEDIYVTCEECSGKRYRADTLKVTYDGKTIDDVLNMTIDDCAELFADIPAIKNVLTLMKDVGLGYLRLGQSATTLSGGEAQRLKICSELSSGKRKDILYVLDEPTVGLHFKDVSMLIQVLRKLVDAGNTVVVIEHNLDVIAVSDWIVDLGPEGGDKGGRIVFEGTPEEIVKVRESYTGRYLNEAMS